MAIVVSGMAWGGPRIDDRAVRPLGCTYLGKHKLTRRLSQHQRPHGLIGLRDRPQRSAGQDSSRIERCSVSRPDNPHVRVDRRPDRPTQDHAHHPLHVDWQACSVQA